MSVFLIPSLLAVLSGGANSIVVAAGDAAAAPQNQSNRIELIKAFRNCALVEKIDVPHGGKLTAAGRSAAESCVVLGMAYEEGDFADEEGRPIERNYVLAFRYYEAACGAEVAFGCLSVGQLVEKGKAQPRNGNNVMSAAAKWYELGCLLPNSKDVRIACFFAGQSTFNSAASKKGKARAETLALALRFFSHACELGDDDSCKIVIENQQRSAKH